LGFEPQLIKLVVESLYRLHYPGLTLWKLSSHFIFRLIVQF
jgi:hypothetical protein